MTPPISLPTSIERAIDAGAAIYISISGGKDSQAIAYAVSWYYKQNDLTNPLYIIHADLGRAEWPQTPDMTEKIAAHIGLPLIVVRRPAGDMLDRFDQRRQAILKKGKEEPPWSSSSNRYCTSDMKRGPIDKPMRKHDLVISVTGIRAEESVRRGRNTPLEFRKYATVRGGITSSIDGLKSVKLPNDAFDQWVDMCKRTPDGNRNPRLALNWNPLMNWTVGDVYDLCGHSMDDLATRRYLYEQGDIAGALDSWNMHPAYVTGNDRLSCVICILGSTNDIRNGAQHNPELAKWYLGREEKWGYTFKNGEALADTLHGLDLGKTAVNLPVPNTPPPNQKHMAVERLTCSVPTQLKLL